MAILVDFNDTYLREVVLKRLSSKCQNPYPCLPLPPFPGKTLICAYICLPTQTLILNFTPPYL